MKTRFILALGLPLVLGFWQTPDQGQTFDPKTTTIALVPVLNLSGEKWAELKERQCQRGNAFLSEQFGNRGFTVLPSAVVQSQIEGLKIDFADEEQQKRAVLYDLGRKLKADLVVMVVITDTSQRTIQQFLSSKKEGTAKLKLWLIDVKKEQPILSAKAVEGKSGGGFFAGLDKGSDRQVIAVANGLRDGLKDFFSRYPEIKKAGGL